MTAQETAATAALLAWYRDMGVDEAVADAPTDWFAASARPPEPEQRREIRPEPVAPTAEAVPPPRETRPPAAAVPPDEAIMDARERARTAATLEELRETLAAFDGCPLKATAKNLCLARGNPAARVMFIGEAPGRDEDLQGQPFVGRAGRLLDKMLTAIALDEDTAYITNVVYWRPPGNRTPTPQEVQACAPFLERQIELVDPEILVFLGGAAAKQMLATTEGIMRLRGKWRRLTAGAKERRAMATLHPAYLLRNPSAKRLAWRDFLAIRVALDDT